MDETNAVKGHRNHNKQSIDVLQIFLVDQLPLQFYLVFKKGAILAQTAGKFSRKTGCEALGMMLNCACGIIS